MSVSTLSKVWLLSLKSVVGAHNDLMFLGPEPASRRKSKNAAALDAHPAKPRVCRYQRQLSHTADFPAASDEYTCVCPHDDKC